MREFYSLAEAELKRRLCRELRDYIGTEPPQPGLEMLSSLIESGLYFENLANKESKMKLYQTSLSTFLSFAALSTLTPASCGPIRRDTGFEIGGIVNTTSGLIQGTASTLRANVSTYLGVPYAQPPVGALRFAAPVPFNGTGSVINATEYSPDCPCNTIPSDEDALGGPAGSKILLALAQAGDTLSEDCLTLNIWSKPQTGDAKKAVLFWIYGGGFDIGNSASPIYNGAVLADENDVVVVTINYRLNIFGFSGAPGTPTNVGLRDQRLALEWTRDNIEAFGGDPDRITVFGQSAGGCSADFLAYMYQDDPIANAFISQSGVANAVISEAVPAELVQNQWYEVSNTLGCGGASAGEATLECVRNQSMDAVLDAMSQQFGTFQLYTGFDPIADGETAPINPSTQGSSGNFSHLPFMTGNTDDEAGLFIIVGLAFTHITPEQEALLPLSILQPILDLSTLFAFTCSAGVAAQYRVQEGVPVWRYRYYGGTPNYTNTYTDYVGSSYHTSELPIVFGTASTVSGIPDTEVEAQAGAYMRNAWASFAKDPYGGLAELGWPQYNPLTNSQVRLSYQSETSASFIPSIETDALCGPIDAVTDFAWAVLEFFGDLPDLLAVAAGDSGTSSGASPASQAIWSALQGMSSNGNGTQNVLDLIETLTSLNSSSSSSSSSTTKKRAPVRMM